MSRSTILVFITCVLLPGALALDEAHAQSGGAVVNEHGISVKVITTRDCQIYEEADLESNSAPCAVFSYWYVLPPDRSAPSRKLEDLESLTAHGFYRVAAGDTEAEAKGWLHEDDVVEWHHRQAVRFAKQDGRDLAHFFPTKEGALEAVTTGDTSAATHREPASAGGRLILMPLLDATPTEVSGAEMELFDVAFMSGATAETGAAGELTKDDVIQNATVDVVFVVDTTWSMKPSIEQMLQSIERVVETLSANETMRARLRFGLVGYRDVLPDMTDYYLTKLFCTLEEGADHAVFIERLAEVETSTNPQGDYPEDVLAGIDLALSDAMGWNPLAWKNIIIVSDSSIKGPDHPDPRSQKNDKSRTIAGILARVQPGTGKAEELLNSGFVISAVSVRHPSSPEDPSVTDRQFDQLVAGRTYQGHMIRVQGGDDPEDFSAELSDRILTMVSGFESAVVKGGPVKGDAIPYPVLDLLRELGDGGGDEAGGMSFTSRYCTEYDSDGNRLFVPHVFVRRGQLQSFNSMVDFLQGALEDAGEPGARDVGQVLRSLQVVSTSLNLAEPITADLPIEDFLQLLLGLPLQTPVFKVTIADLASMSQTDYEDWVQGVKRCHDTLESLLENPNIWYKLHPTAREREEHAFIAMADLP